MCGQGVFSLAVRNHNTLLVGAAIGGVGMPTLFARSHVATRGQRLVMTIAIARLPAIDTTRGGVAMCREEIVMTNVVARDHTTMDIVVVEPSVPIPVMEVGLVTVVQGSGLGTDCVKRGLVLRKMRKVLVAESLPVRLQ